VGKKDNLAVRFSREEERGLGVCLKIHASTLKMGIEKINKKKNGILKTTREWTHCLQNISDEENNVWSPD